MLSFTPIGFLFRPERYALSNWLFLESLAAIYAIAFLSLAVQIKGLIGNRGILPLPVFLRFQRQLWGRNRFWNCPTLCWWNEKDGFLLFLCWGGLGLSLLAMWGWMPALVFALLWLFYLSLFAAGRIFLGYQWDVLLLECGFLAIFLSPLSVSPRWPPRTDPNPAARWLLYAALFRLMFFSGVVKLRSGDLHWRQLTALKYHFETQPLPNHLSWYLHQCPAWFHRASLLFVFAVELVLPWFGLGPWPFRLAAATGTAILMLGILLSGNYGFFNLLTLALCLPLLPDRCYLAIAHAIWPGLSFDGGAPLCGWPSVIVLPVAALLLFLNFNRLLRLFGRPLPWPEWFCRCDEFLQRFCLVNSYGLFSLMTTWRPEIIIEGSRDGEQWLAYEFKWKVGEPGHPPRQVAPHQPRLDWQMWFAGYSDYPRNTWFRNFQIALLKGSPAVLALLKKDPFPNQPPTYIRALLYDYRFTDLATRKQTGAWWRRQRVSSYGPVMTLRTHGPTPDPGPSHPRP